MQNAYLLHTTWNPIQNYAHRLELRMKFKSPGFSCVSVFYNKSLEIIHSIRLIAIELTVSGYLACIDSYMNIWYTRYVRCVATIINIAIVHSMQMDQPDDFTAIIYFMHREKRNQVHAGTHRSKSCFISSKLFKEMEAVVIVVAKEENRLPVQMIVFCIGSRSS